MPSMNSECTCACESQPTKTDIRCLVLNSLPPKKNYGPTLMTFHQKTLSEKRYSNSAFLGYFIYINKIIITLKCKLVVS